MEVEFWSQDVNVGHLVVDFGPLIVNFRLWELILSLGMDFYSSEVLISGLEE